jgi:hypothetical protein
VKEGQDDISIKGYLQHAMPQLSQAGSGRLYSRLDFRNAVKAGNFPFLGHVATIKYTFDYRTCLLFPVNIINIGIQEYCAADA